MQFNYTCGFNLSSQYKDKLRQIKWIELDYRAGAVSMKQEQHAI